MLNIKVARYEQTADFEFRVYRPDGELAYIVSTEDEAKRKEKYLDGIERDKRMMNWGGK